VDEHPEGEEEDPPRRMTAIEALESYSSAHPESIDTLLEWPYRRFVKAFEAWQRRRAIERIERQEDLHIAAMYSNTNMDNPDNHRDQRVRSLQDFYKELRTSIINGGTNEPEAPDEFAQAFMRAGRRNLAIITPEPITHAVADDVMSMVM
jgi:hypothetical protein